MTRQLYEGARPTLERLATISQQVESDLRALASRENWTPLPEAAAIRRRVAAMSDRVLALMEEPDGDDLVAKGRIDAITSLLKAIDKLREIAAGLDDAVHESADDGDLSDAFTAIDRRIEELAHAYARQLGEEKPDAAPDHAGEG